MPGKLFIVGTPIGNMEDITLRALRALREADIIAAEDTRRTGQLLARHGISTHSLSRSPARSHRRGTEGAEEDSAFSAAPRCNFAGHSHPSSFIPHPFPRLVSYHEFNEARRTQELLKELQQGRTVALVTDAGMPTISDPGQRLIQAVVDWNSGLGCHPEQAESDETRRVRADGAIEGSLQLGKKTEIPRQARNDKIIELEIIPGPSAVTMAIAAAALGLTHRRDAENAETSSATSAPLRCKSSCSARSAFLFYGFLPHKATQRRKALTLLAPLPYTLVFFESPYRLLKSLRDMHELLGNRHTVVARELTKKFEEVIRGDLATILKKLENRSIKGEITVVVEGTKE